MAIIQYTYKEWLEQNPDMKELENQKCSNCKGTGEAPCYECHTIVACQECEGKGDFDTARIIYNNQFDKDMEYIKNLAIKNSTIKEKP